MFGLTMSIYASIRFTHAQFELPGSARAWLIPIVLCALAAVVFPGPFESTRATAPVAVVCVGLGLVYQLWLVGRLAFSRGRRGTPKNAIMVLSAWLMVATCGAPDIVAWLGFGELFGGVRTTCLGLTGFALLHSAVLSRDFIAALDTGDRLNEALRDQVKRLAQEQGVVQTLNAELQHQVLVRSEQLSDALTRLVSAQGVAAVFHEGDVIEQRYRVKRPLGAGGMGTVYQVERIADHQAFALKVLTGTPGVRELGRFAREAKLAAAIHHPNVVRVFDAAIGQNGFLFVVFEYVDGESLSAHRKRFGNVPWALQVLRGVARGLDAIHALGIAHRDLKPANVLLCSDANGRPIEVKITDFGVSNVATPASASATSNTSPGSASGEADFPTREDASHATAPPAASNPSTTPPLSLTKAGTILGTPVYMAPEAICEGHLPLLSSDIHSFGVVAFELLTARRPFTEAEAIARAYGYFAGAAPTFEGLGLSPMLEELLARALAGDPVGRPTASEVRQSMDSFCP